METIISYVDDTGSTKPHKLIKKQESGQQCILGLKKKQDIRKIN